jgi:hypothetical protein
VVPACGGLSWGARRSASVSTAGLIPILLTLLLRRVMQILVLALRVSCPQAPVEY